MNITIAVCGNFIDNVFCTENCDGYYRVSKRKNANR